RQLLSDRPAPEPAAGADFASALAAWLERNPVAPGTLYHGALAAFERPLFEHALRQTGGNQLRAAQLLGINRNTLRKRLDDRDINAEGFPRRGAQPAGRKRPFQSRNRGVVSLQRWPQPPAQSTLPRLPAVRRDGGVACRLPLAGPISTAGSRSQPP